MSGNHTRGHATAVAIRWHECAKPGKYIVNVSVDPGCGAEWTELHDVPGYQHNTGFDFMENFDAVVDNYGRLVRVPS